MKKIMFLVFLSFVITILYPKKISGGGVVSCLGGGSASVGTSCMCIGISISGGFGGEASCLGYRYDCIDYGGCPPVTLEALNNQMKKDLSKTSEFIEETGVKVSKNENKKVFEKVTPISLEKFNVDTSDWKNYKNEKYGFEFKYPENMNIVFDDMKMVYSGGNFWYRLILQDVNSSQSPFFSFEINADGYGPLFFEKRYTLKEVIGGGFVVDSSEIIGEDSDNELSLDAHFGKNNNRHWWQITYQKGDVDYDIIFREVLMSFKIR